MDVTVDTSVVIAVIANEPEKQRLIRMTEGADLIAPHSVHWEIGNAFSAMLKRGRIEMEQAAKAIEVYRQICIRFVDVELRKALDIADELGIYAYDAYLVRCAVKYGTALMSLDRGLVEAARQMGVDGLEARR